jgi:hypothetical protein
MSRRTASLLFFCLVAVFCLWVLSLPLFPSQDGPMHKYYVHVLASLLSGSHDYPQYVIRHPFPPYATHYAVLLGLSRFVSNDLAEKILVCLIFVCTAYGVRLCARTMGSGGDWISLCAIPLVLHWSVGMGFLNYSLGLGLFFLAAGLWCRQSWWFALVTAVLTFTHPIPLLLLIVFCGLDLGIRLIQNFSAKDYGWQYSNLAFACICFLYPLASVDRSRSASNLHLFGLHKDALISSLALFGVSPFDTRARNLFINGYRLALCALLVFCVVLAAEGLTGRWRRRELSSADAMLFLSVAILLAIPILPSSMNGSDFFSQRLMVIPWLGAIAAAGATTRRIARWAPAFAVGLAMLTLVPAEMFFRPVARQLAALEQQSLPAHAAGLALLDPAMLKTARVEHQLGFSPYLWSGVLPFLHAGDVMLNSPFMDQTITPLMPSRGSELLISRMGSAEEAERVINGNLDLPSMPAEMRGPLLDSTKFVVLVGKQAHLPFPCEDYGWYLVCRRG